MPLMRYKLAELSEVVEGLADDESARPASEGPSKDVATFFA